MSDDETGSIQAELDAAYAQRDSIKRELGDLRTRICQELGIVRREPGPGGRSVPGVVSDQEIVAAVARLRAETDAFRQPGDGTHPQWARIDYLILEGRRIQALQRIRDEFGGGIHEALGLLDQRSLRLRRDRPDDFVDGD
ncbi:hypothetical protein ACWC24_13310 [Streptomyces sp. NPDC001443]